MSLGFIGLNIAERCKVIQLENNMTLTKQLIKGLLNKKFERIIETEDLFKEFLEKIK